MPSSEVYGYTDAQLRRRTSPSRASAGDQQAALFGQTCFAAGRGEKHLRHRLLPADEHRRDAGASRERPGDHHRLGPRRQSAVTRWRAASSWRARPSSGCGTSCGSSIPRAGIGVSGAEAWRTPTGCYVVPAFTGLGAPHWDHVRPGRHRGPDPRLRTGTTSSGPPWTACAYQTWDVLRAMEADSGIELAALQVDGGASANNYI